MEKYRILSDFFAVPGLFCLFFGALGWLASRGTFQGIGYVLKNALRLLTFQPVKRYEPKENKGREIRPLLIAGVVLIAIASLFSCLYYG